MPAVGVAVEVAGVAVGVAGAAFPVPVAHGWDRSVTVEVPAAGVIHGRVRVARVDRVR